jgi:hypothetical protein
MICEESRPKRRAQFENPRSASRSEVVRLANVVASPVPSTFATALLDFGTLAKLLGTVGAEIFPDASRSLIAHRVASGASQEGPVFRSTLK